MPTQQTTAGVLLPHQNKTMVTPQTPSYPGNPGNPSKDDLGDDLGDDPFNNDNGDNENNNDDIDKATNVLQALGHAIENLAHATWHDEDSSASSGKTRMKDGQHMNKYVMEFNRLTSQVHGYGDGALHHYFYSSLPDHVKDKICQVGKLQALEDLQHLTQEINMHY
ncbi:hypothetical protein ID866_9183 [Astraeus odoratus]|nr:hypothetical protein ID866_9183 [Astraeus odoratus]